MERQALALVGITAPTDEVEETESPHRIKELVSISAAFAINCTSSLERHIASARSIGITDAEIKSVVDAALAVKNQAAAYVDRVGQLKEKVSRLQRLLKELEETQAQLVQSEKMAALGKLVAGLVHEMNSPLGAISSSTDVFGRATGNIVEVLEKTDSLEEVRNSKRLQGSLVALQRDIPVTAEAVERITRIVDSLKSFAHLDEAPFQKVDLHESLDNVLNLMEHEFGDRINVVKKYGDLPPVGCYPGELNQVFMNLLSNALQAIEDKGTITIQTSSVDGSVAIQIADSGTGIPPEMQQRLFEPNFTSKGSRVKAGLGLFTSYNIVQKHDGEIRVESEVGKGSAFTVVLPVDRRGA